MIKNLKNVYINTYQMSNGLDKNQTGFVSKCCACLNFKLAMEKLRDTNKSEGMCTILLIKRVPTIQ